MFSAKQRDALGQAVMGHDSVSMGTHSPQKIYGWIWLAISPLILLVAAISAVEPLALYYIQTAIFGLVAAVGFASGIGQVLSRDWARPCLRILSWIGCLYFFGSGALIAIFAAPDLIEGEADPAFILVTVIGVAIFGIPFLLMAKNLGPVRTAVNDS